MKSRAWATIGYEESLIENWKEELSEMGIQCAISPLHDKDINPTGETKKAHYHILMIFTGPTTYNKVKNICEKIKAVEPKVVMSAKGYYRYLTHEDNPEKYHYNIKDIIKLNGFSIELTTTEVMAIKYEIIGDIKQKNFTEYKQLIDYYYDLGDMEKFDMASKQTIFFNRYITSSRHSEIE